MDVNSFIVGYTKGKQSGLSGFHRVRYFNDDRTTLLYTVFVPTGANAIYAGNTPISTIGGIFVGFEPSPTNVMDDMDCYATYEIVAGLDDTSWETISALSNDGVAKNYFAIGDVKMIHVEGKVGITEINDDYGVYIIGFDHNQSREGKGIHFGTFKTVDGTDVALVDSYFEKACEDGTKCFNMNHWGSTNYGGWGGSDLRYDVLGSTDRPPERYGTKQESIRAGFNPTNVCTTYPVENTLMAALPADLRAVMKPMVKYADNTGGGVTGAWNPSRMVETIDYLPLLSVMEILSYTTQGSVEQMENSVVKQYNYFSQGNSPKKYRHSALTKTGYYRTRTVNEDGDTGFYMIESVNAFNDAARMSYGLAPIFKV